MNNETKLIIDTRRVTESGVTFTGQLSPLVFDISEDNRLQCRSPLIYDLQVAIVNQALLIQGIVKTILRCRCDRCLVDYEQPVSYDRILHYLDITKDKFVDLTLEIREDILIGFPQKCLCSQKCLGLCRTCGRNLNNQMCDCNSNNRVVPAWDILNNLDL